MIFPTPFGVRPLYPWSTLSTPFRVLQGVRLLYSWSTPPLGTRSTTVGRRRFLGRWTPIGLVWKQIVPTPVDMDLYDHLIQYAVMIASHPHYMVYLSVSSSFLMKLIDNSEHLFYTEPHTGVGLNRPHRPVAKKREPFLTIRNCLQP